MVIERIAVSRVNPAPWNPRADLQPGDVEYDKVRRSIEEFGLIEPLVWNRRTGNLVGGHQRLKVLIAQGQTAVDVSVVDLPPEREKALNLALNKIQGAWDEPKLAALLEELTAVPNFDLEVTGFEVPEVDELLARLAAAALEDKDETFDLEAALETKAAPVTKPGNLIELGPHRVLCGDATKAEDIGRLMKGEQASLVFTDPPYAVDYRGGRVGKAWAHKIRGDGERYWDDLTPGAYLDLLKGALANARDFSDDPSALYLWFASARIRQVLDALAATGWAERNLIVWVKNTFAGSLYAQYKHRYEPCFYCHKTGKAPRWFGPTNETTVWEHDKPHRNEGHPTVKPVELAVRGLENSSRPGHVVLDLFLGSGTTLIAAAKTGRRCFGTEIEPRYCDLIIRRYIAFLGDDQVDPAVAQRYLVKEDNP